MQHKLLGTVALASLGAVLALSVPADARPFGHGGGHVGGGHVSAAPMARSGPSFSGSSHVNSPRFTANNAARFNARPSNNFVNTRPSNNFVANNSYARANGNWPGHNGNWRHHHHRGGAFAAGVGLGLAFGAPYAYGYGYCDPYAYDCGDGYGPSYAYDEGYDTYAAASEAADVSVQYCMQHYRSYDLATRTYLGLDGERHSCP